MSRNELTAILAAVLLPTVKADMEDDTDLLEVIQESVKYAGDIIEEVENPDPDPEEDGGEVVEIIPPSGKTRRHA